MLTIFQARKEEHQDIVRQLFREYLEWAILSVNRDFGVGFDMDSMLERDMLELDKFLPPDGRLLLAEYQGQIAGLACMKKLRDRTGEIKRMYVRPPFRRKGIGRALVKHLIQEAGLIGYTRIWLDSPRSWKAAHGLYRSVGFEEIEPYPESEIPAEFQPYWIFMGLQESAP